MQISSLRGWEWYWPGARVQSDMLIPNKIRKCVVYLGVKRHFEDPNGAAHTEIKVAGTALLVGRLFEIEDEKYTTRVFGYLVTAKHIIDRIQNLGCAEVQIRFNLVDGTSKWLPSNVGAWLFHPTDPNGIDVAVLPARNPPEKMDHIVYPFDEILSQAALVEKGLGLGDEVFLTGLFWHHQGEQQSIPIIRTGNIAAMPEEKVKVKDFGTIDAYLIELRSISGISGSPVFAYLGHPHADAKGRALPRRAPSGGDWIDSEFYMFGLIHGHFRTKENEVESFLEDSEAPENLNVRIAIVVPGDKIIEVLTQSGIRDEEEREVHLSKFLRTSGNVVAD